MSEVTDNLRKLLEGLKKLSIVEQPQEVVDNRTFEEELRGLINKHSREEGSNTPDWILADFLIGCLRQFNRTMVVRDDYYAPPTPIIPGSMDNPLI